MSRRYFDDESKVKPGVISEELRQALDLHSDKLPIWIYRMRVLGYPPGWLQRAKVSTLTIFDGNNVTEDGELNEAPETQEYNKDAFVEYPGFNSPVPPGVRDDWYILRMPPMLETQQLKEALKTMKVSEPVPYKRTKLDISSMSSSSTSSTPKSLKRKSSHNSNSNFSLNEINSTPNKSKDDLNSGNNSIESTDLSIISSHNSTTLSSDSLNDSTKSERKLKLVAMGSPMPASERPKRPSLDKWAEGMGELLYFENPNTDYVGVYQNKMKGLIDKIRRKNSQ